MEIALLRFNSQKGEFAFSTAVKLMAATLLVAAMMAVFHVYYVIGGVREKVNESVTAVAATKSVERSQGFSSRFYTALIEAEYGKKSDKL